jgi:hypothetical protein
MRAGIFAAPSLFRARYRLTLSQGGHRALLT